MIIFIELFAMAFSSSWSITVRAYTAEIQPNRTRAAATSVGQALNQLVNAVIVRLLARSNLRRPLRWLTSAWQQALTAPAFLAKSSYGPYMLYGACTAFATIVAYFTMFETRGKSLET